MQMHKPIKLTSEEKRRRVAKQIWLQYYNEILYQQGIITEEAHNHMKIKIDMVYQCWPADPYLYSGLQKANMIKWNRDFKKQEKDIWIY